MTVYGSSLVSAATLAKLEQLQLHSRERLIGRFAGEHDSSRFGDSVDFADFREYHPGDDFRRIDYHVLARLDHLLIKLFEADDTITTRILVDSSGSMATGDKLLQAKRLAAMLGFISLINNDTVNLYTIRGWGDDAGRDGGGAPTLAPKRFNGRAAYPVFHRHLTDLEPSGLTPFAHAASEVMGSGGLRGVTVVISDLLTRDWPALVRLRADRSALVVIQVLDRSDRTVTFEGDVDLVDRETETRQPLSVVDELRELYETDVERFLADVTNRCRSVGAAHIVVDADADAEQLMLSRFRTAEVVR